MKSQPFGALGPKRVPEADCGIEAACGSDDGPQPLTCSGSTTPVAGTTAMHPPSTLRRLAEKPGASLETLSRFPSGAHPVLDLLFGSTRESVRGSM